MCFKSRFKQRERVTVLNRDRERVPDRWCGNDSFERHSETDAV